MAYLVLLAEVLIFFRHVLFYKHFVIPWDFRYYHFPLASFAAKSFDRGELPLWDPFTFCGMPVYANLTAQVFYPPTILAMLASNWTGGAHLLYFLELQLVAHVFLGGAFAYLLLRRLLASPAAALIGATIYQLGAFFSSQTQHLGAIDGAAWLPLAWLGVMALSDGFRWRRLAVLIVALTMSILAGFPALTAVVFGSALFLAVSLVAFRQSSYGLIGSTAAAAIWALGLAAIQLFPTMELTRLSVARFRSDFLGTGGGVPWQALISLILPNHYGVWQFRGGAWSLPWDPTFLYLYCGLAALVFAAIAITRRKGPHAVVIGTLTALFLVWMLGDSTPLGRILFPLLPVPIRSALYAEFAMAAFTLGLALLAGLGAHHFLAGRSRAWSAAAVLLVAGELIAVSSGRPINTASEREEPGIDYQHIAGYRIIPERVRALTRVNFPPARIDTINASLNWSGAAALLEIPSANGADPFALIRLMQVRLSFCKGERWGRYYQVADPDSPVLKLMNVRYLLADRPVATTGRLIPAGEVVGTRIYENLDALPRFFVVHKVRHAPDMETALRYLRSPEFNMRTEAIVEETDPTVVERSGVGEAAVQVLEYAPRRIRLSVDSSTPGFLVTSEAFYPGWRAFLDGSERKPALTNVAFRGLPVPAGRHTVTMEFDPPILRWSAIVTMFSAALLIAAVAFGDNRKKSGSWTSSRN